MVPTRVAVKKTVTMGSGWTEGGRRNLGASPSVRSRPHMVGVTEPVIMPSVVDASPPRLSGFSFSAAS